MPAWILVAFGGALGALARYYLGLFVSERLSAQFPTSPLSAPAGTLLINVTGCFLIGLFAAWSVHKASFFTPDMRLLLAVGFCGAFTTFSTYGLEVVTLIQRGYGVQALWVFAGSNLLGVGAVALGAWLGRGLG